MSFRRVVVLVLDSVGVGEMPDSAAFGDVGSNTLAHVAASRPLLLPNLLALGLGNIGPLADLPPSDSPSAAFGKSALASGGKDTTSGHWEMAGVTMKTPFPVYPDGFPAEVLAAFKAATGLDVLGNVAESGTAIIERLGQEHVRTGLPIIYTSADSVFQVAAHEESFGLDRLYEICTAARDLLRPPHEVGRVIARPFVGSEGDFTRTYNRKDYAIPPPRPTLLDRLLEAGITVEAVGKIASIFCYRGISWEHKAGNNAEVGSVTLDLLRGPADDAALVFANFVDFDMLYGHRNDIEGYASALEAFDWQLARIRSALRADDLLILTSDHGCDPSTASSDHSREYTLLLATHSGMSVGPNLGTRGSLADIGATIAENFGVELEEGDSFLAELVSGP